MEITWNSKSGVSYTIEGTGDLIGWAPVEQGIAAVGDSTTRQVAIAPGTRYFRVRIETR
jgi:hypothetical protein